ncbi:MAG: 4'-phosphopantetheinyl transferase superfamily protein [Rhodobacteraceae bacterium]|nr:4'-phosphopantetheinyl transferase superfamily protein [Paracoccaceae bacterium]
MTPIHETEAGRQHLKLLAARLFGDGVSVGVARIANCAEAGLLPVEAAAITSAVPARRAEFAAGRAAAREALGRVVAIPMGVDRAPVWPEGIAGSIAHAGGWAMAVVSGGAAGIGLDLEVDEPLPEEVIDIVVRPEEQGDARVIFCVKEAVYKAVYPQVRQIFGFDVLSVVLNGDAFTARFTEGMPPFAEGHVLRGRVSRGSGFILAGVVL